MVKILLLVDGSAFTTKAAQYLVDHFGVLKGKLTVAADFDAPLPADVLAAFEGR